MILTSTRDVPETALEAPAGNIRYIRTKMHTYTPSPKTMERTR
jgi:hypothetical protein